MNLKELFIEKKLTIAAGLLTLAAWFVAHKQQEEKIQDAVEKWFEDNVEPIEEAPAID